MAPVPIGMKCWATSKHVVVLTKDIYKVKLRRLIYDAVQIDIFQIEGYEEVKKHKQVQSIPFWFKLSNQNYEYLLYTE